MASTWSKNIAEGRATTQITSAMDNPKALWYGNYDMPQQGTKLALPVRIKEELISARTARFAIPGTCVYTSS